jgi:transcriptional regulator with XRE-family HTH domain
MSDRATSRPGTPIAGAGGTSARSVPRPNQTELWQRLRAARELANKSHHDVGQVVGLDEAMVALWESPDPAQRLQPTAQQVMRIAKLCRLPLYLLVDDAVSMQDIQSYTAP